MPQKHRGELRFFVCFICPENTANDVSPHLVNELLSPILRQNIQRVLGSQSSVVEISGYYDPDNNGEHQDEQEGAPKEQLDRMNGRSLFRLLRDEHF